jgi:uncharacterized protein (DUF4415 family)
MADDTQDNVPSRASLGRAFWRQGSPVYPSRNRKLVRVRLDPEVLEWFGLNREDEHGGLNTVLRAYVERRKAEE